MDKARIALEALITEREGMIAENGQRMYSGQAMAYVGDNFQELADQIRSLGKGGQEISGPGSLPATVYLVIQRRIGPDVKDDIDGGAIIGGFAVAKDGYGWIKRQHNPEAYFLEPLKVIKEGGGE